MIASSPRPSSIHKNGGEGAKGGRWRQVFGCRKADGGWLLGSTGQLLVGCCMRSGRAIPLGSKECEESLLNPGGGVEVVG
jgi:hypothetical protein